MSPAAAMAFAPVPLATARLEVTRIAWDPLPAMSAEPVRCRRAAVRRPRTPRANGRAAVKAGVALPVAVAASPPKKPAAQASTAESRVCVTSVVESALSAQTKTANNQRVASRTASASTPRAFAAANPRKMRPSCSLATVAHEPGNGGEGVGQKAQNHG